MAILGLFLAAVAFIFGIVWIMLLMKYGLFGPRDENDSSSNCDYSPKSGCQDHRSHNVQRSEDLPDHLSEAKALMGAGQYHRAIVYLEEMTISHPRNLSVFFNLGECYEGIEVYAKAILNYEKCLSLGRNAIVSRRLGNIFFAANDFAKAKLHYLNSNKTAEVNYMLGLCYLGLGELSNAEGIVAKIANSDYRSKLLNLISNYKQQNEREREAGNGKNRYYTVLDLQVGAPKDEIKQAYRVLVKVWHPDRFNHDPKLQLKAEQKMKDINEAYEVLCKV